MEDDDPLVRQWSLKEVRCERVALRGKNLGKSYDKNPRHARSSNSQGGTDRWGGEKFSRRIADLRENRLVSRHMLTDQTLTALGDAAMPLKTIGKNGIGLATPSGNPQSHHSAVPPLAVPQAISLRDLLALPRFVCLTSLSPRLHLSDRNCLTRAACAQYSIALIVNACDLQTAHPLGHSGKSVQVVGAPLYDDNANYGYHHFCGIAETVAEAIDDLGEHRNVVFVCDRAVNRSVGLLMYYAITRLGKNYSQALAAVEFHKRLDNRWNNLTNVRLRNTLQAVSSR